MNACLCPEAMEEPDLGRHAAGLSTGKVDLSELWIGRFGAMLIEVIDGTAYVNGQQVEPARLEPPKT